MSRGVEAILYVRNGKERVIKRNSKQIKNWDRPIWVSNIMLDEVPGYSKVINFDELLMSMVSKERIILVPIKLFLSNGNIVNVSKMFTDSDTLVSAFFKRRNALRLITIPAKSKEEILAVGQDPDGKYRFPLMLSLRNKRYTTVNL